MAESTVPKVRRDGKITILDGTTPAANEYEIAYEDGDLSLSRDKNARIVIRDRGTIVGVRDGDQPVLSIGFTVHMREFTNGGALTLIDVLEKTGNANGWASVSSGAFEPYMLKCKIEVEGTNHGDGADHTMTADKVIFTWDFSEGDPNKISVKGEIYGALTATGTP
jgi:hypothetical protein